MTRGFWIVVVAALGCSPTEDGADGGTSTSVADGGDDPSSGTAADESTGADLPLVEIHTTLGNIVLRLRPDVAPGTVDNFVAYAESGFYDGTDSLGPTIVHRVQPGYIVQMGGLTADLSAKATMGPIASEAGELSNEKGTVAMALAAGDPDSAESQFFINVTDNPDLDNDPPFTVFATVELGIEHVEAMSNVPTMDVPPFDGVPVDTITIEMVTVL